MSLVKNPKIIYVSGPYRDPKQANVVHNITRAWEAAHKIWDAGHIAICPHTNTLMMSDPQNGDTFIAGDLHIIRRCVDAVLLVGDWGSSRGAKAERAFAIGQKIPVFRYLESLQAWLKDEGEKESPVHRILRKRGTVRSAPYPGKKKGTQKEFPKISEGLALADKMLAEVEKRLEGNHPMMKGCPPSKLETFPGGAKRSSDAGRGRYDLISPLFLRRLALQLELGAVHPDIGARNWEKGIGTTGGIPLERFQNSRARHLAQADAGQTDEDHLAAAAFNLMCEIHIDELSRRNQAQEEPIKKEGALPLEECIEEGCNNPTANLRCASCWSLFNADY